MFETDSPYPMIDMDEAWRRITPTLQPLPPIVLPMEDVLGYVLAEDIAATENMPPFPSSSMDGYAVIAGDAHFGLRVIAEQTAGSDQAFVVGRGTAARIMTGAPLPQGADAVVQVEWTSESDGVMSYEGAARPGLNVRPAGQDIAIGDVVLSARTVIGPAEIGLLATVGRVRVPVHPLPTAAIMATGDELVPPDQTPGPGKIRNSNSYALAAAVEAAGFRAVRLGQVEDTFEAQRAAILDGLSRADMVITSGGVSMGTRDLIKPILAELGTIHFGRLRVKPGKPLTYATVNGQPVFGLPGFPVSSLVGFENLVRPALRVMAGHRLLWRPEIAVRLAHDIRHAPDRTEYQRAVIEARDGEHWATTTGVQVSGRLKSLVGADAFLRLPAGQADFGQGDTVAAILIGQPEVS